MSKPQSTPNPDKTAKTLNAAPFVFDAIKHVPVRAWRPSNPTAKTAEQITVALGTVSARIAGSTVTFPMDVQIVFTDKTSSPDVVLRQPWQSAPGGRGGNPLFTADDGDSGAKLTQSLESITDRFLDEYRKLPVEQRVDLDSIDYKLAESLIKAKTGGVRRTLARKSA